LADDLVGFVALEPLGPDVPAEDVSPTVDEEDGVVAHAGHELGEVLLALPQPGPPPGVGRLQRLLGCGPPE
jgi:hypothetical protein